MKRHRKRKWLLMAALAILGSLAFVAASSADTVFADGDATVPPPNLSFATSPGTNQRACTDLGTDAAGAITVNYTGNSNSTHYTPGDPFDVVFDIPSGSGITASATTTNVPADWGTTTSVNIPITTNVPSGTLDGTYQVGVTVYDTNTNGYSANGKQNYNVIVACGNVAPPANTAPVIAWTANPSSVNEDATNAQTYSFSITDPDSSSWTFVNNSPDCGTGGSLVANSASIDNTGKTGTFQCLFPDGPASPTVSAQISDGTDNSNTLTQPVTVANVAPTVGAFTPVSSLCGVSISSVGFTDPALAYDNAFAGTVNWGDGASGNPFSLGSVNYGSTFGPLSYTYSVGGSYTITVGVTDKDGGLGTNTANINNTFSVVGWPVPPIMPGKTFKVGSTIPVKIQTTGCPGGEAVTISLDPASTTPKSSGNSNDGISLRFTSALPGYIYNFSTKSNWPAGTYVVTVTFTGPFAHSYSTTIQLTK